MSSLRHFGSESHSQYLLPRIALYEHFYKPRSHVRHVKPRHAPSPYQFLYNNQVSDPLKAIRRHPKKCSQNSDVTSFVDTLSSIYAPVLAPVITTTLPERSMPLLTCLAVVLELNCLPWYPKDIRSVSNFKAIDATRKCGNSIERLHCYYIVHYLRPLASDATKRRNAKAIGQLRPSVKSLAKFRKSLKSTSPRSIESSVDAMAAQVKLHSIPDNSPLKVLLLRKCMRRIDKLKSFGIEQVRSGFSDLRTLNPPSYSLWMCTNCSISCFYTPSSSMSPSMRSPKRSTFHSTMASNLLI